MTSGSGEPKGFPPSEARFYHDAVAPSALPSSGVLYGVKSNYPKSTHYGGSMRDAIHSTTLYGRTVTTYVSPCPKEYSPYDLEFISETVDDSTGDVVNIRAVVNNVGIGIYELHTMQVGAVYMWNTDATVDPDAAYQTWWNNRNS